MEALNEMWNPASTAKGIEKLFITTLILMLYLENKAPSGKATR
jgi:hypothetical protein